jgi:putative mRNA 3-end processing factor
MVELITLTDKGLYCPQGDFYIDPWHPVKRSIITHAHSDHLQAGNDKYLAVRQNKNIIRTKLGAGVNIELINYGQPLNINDVQVSLHPSGHILGAVQIRLAYKGEVWVFSGDYKLQADKTCSAFELIKCHTFITESTFALPIYRWTAVNEVISEINTWWSENKEQGLASVLFCYALGKAQRILSEIDSGIGPIYTHGAVERLTENYRQEGIILPNTTYVGDLSDDTKFGGSLILAPPLALGSRWLKQFIPYSSGFVSG